MADDPELHWATPECLRALLVELVGWQSVTRTAGETAFPERLVNKLSEVPYLAANPGNIATGAADGDQRFVTALYESGQTQRTVVLISHHDTVSCEDYGALEPLACEPERLEPALREIAAELDADAQADLVAGGWLWGRGTMDMKMGLALHMSLVERAAAESWPINLVLLSVPDEEVNSAGMRAAAAHLVALRDAHDLDYVLFLNGEFGVQPAAEDARTLHTGSIGKLMPSALVYGHESHAGSPTDGVTSSWIASYLTHAMEWTDAFRETSHGDVTPVPVSLDVGDVREGYSTKTPYRTSALYNVFVMEQGAGEVFDTFEAVTRTAAAAWTRDYLALCTRESAVPVTEALPVLRYETLLEYATDKLGSEHVSALVDASATASDEREQAFQVVDALLRSCQELTPCIVILFTPPAYPAVNSTGDALVERLVARVSEIAAEQFGVTIERGHYYPWISDLSYVDFRGQPGSWDAYERNMPRYGTTYSIPFDSIAKLRAPVFNLGPLGKDAHTRTERLHIASAFHELPVLAEALLREVF